MRELLYKTLDPKHELHLKEDDLYFSELAEEVLIGDANSLRELLELVYRCGFQDGVTECRHNGAYI